MNIAVVVATVGALVVLSAQAGMQKFVTQPANVYASGIVIDGVNAGGETYEAVRAKLLANEAAYKQTLGATVTIGGKTLVLTAADLGYSSNLDEVLSQAKAHIDNSAPLTERFNETQSVRISGAEFTTNVTLDPSQAKTRLEEFAREMSTSPVDATAKFDPITETFIFKEGRSGMTYLPAQIEDAVLAAAMSGAGGTFECPGTVVEPERTETETRYNTILIGECVTFATKHPDRNINIRLMCEAVNGVVIQPGETFSINALVGERTEAKGFKKAPSIVSAQLVDDFGGGICQLSGTLYNAALLADMEIAERHHHTWPSDYLPIGLDATLNWDNKDLKLYNRSDWPIYIHAALNETTQEVAVRLYGSPNKDGYDVAVRTELKEELPAPSPDIIRTDKLKPGEKQVVEKSRKGYSVEVYRDYYSDSKLVYSEIISKDYFRPIKGVIMVGTDSTQK